MIYAEAALKSCLQGFLFSCLRHLRIPKVWRRAVLVVIPKPSKPKQGSQKQSSNLFALCLLEDLRKLIHSSFKPTIGSLLSTKQVGFRRGKSAVNQPVLLT